MGIYEGLRHPMKRKTRAKVCITNVIVTFLKRHKTAEYVVQSSFLDVISDTSEMNRG